MNNNFKKFTKYIVLLIIGMSFIIFGILNIAIDINTKELTEQEIIEKAKELGMVEIKDTIKNNDKSTNKFEKNE